MMASLILTVHVEGVETAKLIASKADLQGKGHAWGKTRKKVKKV
jgi:hypothetical protein